MAAYVSHASNRWAQRSRNEQPSPDAAAGTDLSGGAFRPKLRRRAAVVLARDRRQQRPRVGMLRIVEQGVDRPLLDDLAQVHHGHTIGSVVDDRQVVGNEQVGQAVLLLEVLQQVDDLRLDRDIQRRHRLVQDQQLRIDSQRATDADTLPLAARQLVRISPAVLRAQPDVAEQRRDPLPTGSSPPPMPVDR